MATDYMSTVKVKFFMPVEKVGGQLMAIWVSWVVVCFTTMTLHTAPLARNFLGGAFQARCRTRKCSSASGRTACGWAGCIASRGALSRLGESAPFDARGDYIYRYADRCGRL